MLGVGVIVESCMVTIITEIKTTAAPMAEIHDIDSFSATTPRNPDRSMFVMSSEVVFVGGPICNARDCAS